MTNIHVRFLRYSAFYTPLLLTLGSDDLEKAGITVSYDTVTPERSIEQGFQQGLVQVAQSAPAVGFLGALAGQPVAYRHFALLNARDGFFLAARDRTRPFSWDALVGKTVLVDHFFQPLALFRTALRRQGIDERQVKFVDAGTVTAMEAAFRAGEGDFLHMQGPGPQQLEHEGLARVVAAIGEVTEPLAFSSLCAHPEWLVSEKAQHFMGAYRRARREAQTLPAAELASRVAPYLEGLSLPVLTATLEAYQRLGTWAGDATISPELFEATVTTFRDIGYIADRPAMSDILVSAP